jgi:hypothetical protein
MAVDLGRSKTSRLQCVTWMPVSVPMEIVFIGPEQSSNDFRLNSPHEQLCLIPYSRGAQASYVTSVPVRRVMKIDWGI